MYHSACTYGSKSSNIAASKVTRSETLPTNKTYQLNKRDRCKQSRQAGASCTQYSAHNAGFQNRIPELNVDRKNTQFICVETNQDPCHRQSVSFGFRQAPSLQQHSLLDDSWFVPPQDAPSQKGDLMACHTGTHTQLSLPSASVFEAFARGLFFNQRNLPSKIIEFFPPWLSLENLNTC